MVLLHKMVEGALPILVQVLVPGLVWGTVVAGLFLVVRDKVEEDDLVAYLSDQEGGDQEADSELESGKFNARLSYCDQLCREHGLGQKQGPQCRLGTFSLIK